jgi:hypothetical protein
VAKLAHGVMNFLRLSAQPSWSVIVFRKKRKKEFFWEKIKNFTGCVV